MIDIYGADPEEFVCDARPDDNHHIMETGADVVGFHLRYYYRCQYCHRDLFAIRALERERRQQE